MAVSTFPIPNGAGVAAVDSKPREDGALVLAVLEALEAPKLDRPKAAEEVDGSTGVSPDADAEADDSCFPANGKEEDGATWTGTLAFVIRDLAASV